MFFRRPQATRKSMVVAERQPKTREYKTEPGPIEQRKVRDVLFIIMFVVVWIGMFVVAGLAIKNGNTKRLRYGRDYLGNLCGDKTSITLGGSVQTFDFTNSKYLYYVDVGFVDNPEPICVKTCPKFSNVTAVKIDDIIDEQYKAPKLASEFAVNRTLPEPYYDVQSISYRCVPISGFKYSWNNTLIPKFGNSDEASNSQNIVMGDVNARDALSSIWETLDESIIYIAISLLIGTALSFLFLLVIQVFGDAVVWITLVVTNVVFFALGAFFLVNWKAAMNGTTKLYSNSLVNSSIQNKNIMLGTGIASVVIGFLMLCMTLFLRKRIALAIELIDQGSKAMRAIPSLLLVPLFKYVILMGVFAWSLFIMSLLSSSGELISQAVVSGSSRVAAKYQPNQVLNYLQIFYFFGTMWTFEFIIAIAQCITAGAVAQWYWTMDKKNFPKGMLGKSVARTLKYHLGSLALGSFLIASLKTVRALLQYAQYQSKKTKSKIVQNALSVLACCIVCFEMFLKFLNTNAYIEIAIYGFGFCEAASEAFHLLWRNALKTVVVNGVGDFVMFLGKALITALTTFITFILLDRANGDGAGDSGDSNSKGQFMLPLLFVALGTYFIASLFMSILQLSVQTVFLSLLEDGERHDGSQARPYFAPDQLKPFLQSKPSQQMAQP